MVTREGSRVGVCLWMLKMLPRALDFEELPGLEFEVRGGVTSLICDELTDSGYLSWVRAKRKAALPVKSVLWVMLGTYLV